MNAQPEPKQQRDAQTGPRPQRKSSRLPHQLEVAGGPVSVQNGLVLGRSAQTQGLSVGRQGALVVPAFEQLVALLAQLLHRTGLWREWVETSGVSSGQGRGAGREETGGHGQVPWRAKTGGGGSRGTVRAGEKW